MSLCVLFETCLRRRGEVLMGRCCYALLRRRHDVPIICHGDVPLRRLGDVPRRRHWVFHLRRTCDAAGTYREMSLRCQYEVLLSDGKAVDNNSDASYKTQKMCSKNVCSYLSAIQFVCRCYKTQEICDQAICTCSLVYYFIPDRYMTR